jgi:hypothetical protein
MMKLLKLATYYRVPEKFFNHQGTKAQIHNFVPSCLCG